MVENTKAITMMAATTDGNQWVYLDGIPSIHAYQHSKRVAECWEAIRKAGGDPAVVAETLMLLTRMLAMHGDGCHCVVCADTRNVLRKAGRLS